jgi:DNA-binding SARP family transcriptional activator
MEREKIIYVIELFGALQVYRGREFVARLRSSRAALLLAYLALRPGQRIAREVIATAFWPDMEPEAARNNLSVALSKLRGQLGEAQSLIHADSQSIGLIEAATSDVALFRARIEQAKRVETNTALEHLEEASRLYPTLSKYSRIAFTTFMRWISVSRAS